jgi:hypothetical protein
MINDIGSRPDFRETVGRPFLAMSRAAVTPTFQSPHLTGSKTGAWRLDILNPPRCYD